MDNDKGFSLEEKRQLILGVQRACGRITDMQIETKFKNEMTHKYLCFVIFLLVIFFVMLSIGQSKTQKIIKQQSEHIDVLNNAIVKNIYRG